MLKAKHRVAGDRCGLRYPLDLNDAECSIIAPMIPRAKRGGRKPKVYVREVLNAICYILATGSQWKALHKDIPFKSNALAYFMLWEWNGKLERIHDALYFATSEAIGKEPSPAAAIFDSQSAKAVQKGLHRLIPH